MSNTPPVLYVPRPDTTPESELSVLANVYADLIKTNDSKKAAEVTQPRVLQTHKVVYGGRRLG